MNDAAAVRGDLTRLLGNVPTVAAPVETAPAAASRFKLVGVVAPKSDNPQLGGVAVISVDGKPPRAFRVGARLDTDLMLRSVALRSAAVANGKGASLFTLELPLRTAAATGKLPAVSMDGNSIPSAPPGVFAPPPGQMPMAVPVAPEPVPDASQMIPNQGIDPNQPAADEPPPFPSQSQPPGSDNPGDPQQPLDQGNPATR